MRTETAELIPVGLMGCYGMPVDRFYGQPMDAVTWITDPFMHIDPSCRAAPSAGLGETHRVHFGAFTAARMCRCCRVEAAAADSGLEGAIVALVFLCEGLEEETEEEENRRRLDYVPDFRGSNFNWNHWRYLQFQLAETTDGLQAHPWLYYWARPALARAAAYAERRCEEQQTLIDTATIEQAAVTLQQRETSTARLAQAWQTWRQCKGHARETSPDDAYYDQNARLRPPNPSGIRSRAATVEISMRLPPLGPTSSGTAWWNPCRCGRSPRSRPIGPPQTGPKASSSWPRRLSSHRSY